MNDQQYKWLLKALKETSKGFSRPQQCVVYREAMIEIGGLSKEKADAINIAAGWALNESQQRQDMIKDRIIPASDKPLSAKAVARAEAIAKELKS